MWCDSRGDGSKLNEVQEAVNPEFANDLTYIGLFGNEGTFETTEIDGKSYVLVATPFT